MMATRTAGRHHRNVAFAIAGRGADVEAKRSSLDLPQGCSDHANPIVRRDSRWRVLSWQTSSPMTYKSSSAVSDVSLAPFGLSIIPAMQPSAHPRETGQCVAMQSCDAVSRRPLIRRRRHRELRDGWPSKALVGFRAYAHLLIGDCRSRLGCGGSAKPCARSHAIPSVRPTGSLRLRARQKHKCGETRLRIPRRACHCAGAAPPSSTTSLTTASPSDAYSPDSAAPKLGCPTRCSRSTRSGTRVTGERRRPRPIQNESGPGG
jgi:hypothetical protein